MWVLTAEYNQYDQFGEYFVACWRQKPTAGQLRDTLNTQEYSDTNLIDHLMKGGGRRNYEDQWYELYEIEEGKNYHV